MRLPFLSRYEITLSSLQHARGRKARHTTSRGDPPFEDRSECSLHESRWRQPASSEIPFQAADEMRCVSLPSQEAAQSRNRTFSVRLAEPIQLAASLAHR